MRSTTCPSSLRTAPIDVWTRLHNLLEAHHLMRLLMTGDACVQYGLTNAIRDVYLVEEREDDHTYYGDSTPTKHASNSSMFRQLVMCKARHLSASCAHFAHPAGSIHFPLLTSLHFQRSCAWQRIDWSDTLEPFTSKNLQGKRDLFDLSKWTPNLKSLSLKCPWLDYCVRLPSSLERLEVIDARSCHDPLAVFINMDALLTLTTIVLRKSPDTFANFSTSTRLPPNLTSLAMPVNYELMQYLPSLPASVKRLRLFNACHFDTTFVDCLALTELVVEDAGEDNGTCIMTLPPSLTSLVIGHLLDGCVFKLADPLASVPPSVTHFSLSRVGPHPEPGTWDPTVVFGAILRRLDLAGVIRLLPDMVASPLPREWIDAVLKRYGADANTIATAPYEDQPRKATQACVRLLLRHMIDDGVPKEAITSFFKKRPHHLNGMTVRACALGVENDWVKQLTFDACRLGATTKINVDEDSGLILLPDDIARNITDLSIQLRVSLDGLAQLLSSNFCHLKRMRLQLIGSGLTYGTIRWSQVMDVVCARLSAFKSLNEIKFVSEYNNPVRFDSATRQQLAALNFVAEQGSMYRFYVNDSKALTVCAQGAYEM